MRKITALLLGVFLPLIGLPQMGHAQSSVQIQGSIEAVDCQGQTFVLSGVGGTNTIAAEAYTPVLVNSTSVPFCALQQYIGAPATVWLVASGSQFVATRIDVVGEAAVVTPPPAPVEPEVAPAPLPIAGIVLGTIIVAGLLYLLVHDHDGAYYRYPYYGPYYRHYYRSEYRAFAGPYPRFAPIITPAPPIVGAVLGTTAVDGLPYLVARDRDGRFSRYPYYGPYHRYYYRAEYRPYQGYYRDAPVRQADLRWDPPTNRDPRYRAPGPQQAPVPQQAPRWTPGPYFNGAPANPNSNPSANPNDPRRNVPAYRDPRYQAPVPQQAPALQPRPVPQQAPQWTPPPYRNGAPGNPNWNPPTYPNDPRRNVPAYRDPRYQAPVPQQAPQWTPPPYRNGAPGNPNWNPPTYPNDPRRNVPTYRDQRNQAPAPQGGPRWAPPSPQGDSTRNDRRRIPSTNPGAPGQCGGRDSGGCSPSDRQKS